MGLNILAWVKAKKYTDNAVSQSAALHREIVTSLPITGDDKVIYMVPVTGSGDDNYNEYMWINGAYELIGNTRVDLTDYYNKTQVDAALSGKANTSDIPTALSQLTADSTHRVVTDTEKSTWNGKSNFSGSYNDLSNKPTIPTTLAGLSDDSTHRVVTDTEKTTWNAITSIGTTYLDQKISNLSAGAVGEVDFDFSIPSGCKIIAISCAYAKSVESSTTYKLDVIGIDIFGSSVLTAYVKNNTNATRTNCRVMVQVLYMKRL